MYYYYYYYMYYNTLLYKYCIMMSFCHCTIIKMKDKTFLQFCQLCCSYGHQGQPFINFTFWVFDCNCQGLVSCSWLMHRITKNVSRYPPTLNHSTHLSIRLDFIIKFDCKGNCKFVLNILAWPNLWHYQILYLKLWHW